VSAADEFPDVLVQYFQQRETARATAVAKFLDGLGNRERALMREAAVMGWVQGMRHHDLPCPKDSKILATVVEACLSMPDIYPVIAHVAEAMAEVDE
jgi:hypothetical protein